MGFALEVGTGSLAGVVGHRGTGASCHVGCVVQRLLWRKVVQIRAFFQQGYPASLFVMAARLQQSSGVCRNICIIAIVCCGTHAQCGSQSDHACVVSISHSHLLSMCLAGLQDGTGSCTCRVDSVFCMIGMHCQHRCVWVLGHVSSFLGVEHESVCRHHSSDCLWNTGCTLNTRVCTESMSSQLLELSRLQQVLH